MIFGRFNIKKTYFILTASFCAVLLLSGCSMEASLEQLHSAIDELPNTANQRKEPDFITGEIVTTGNGVVVKGTFGEISEKQVLSSGVTVEGVFYE